MGSNTDDDINNNNNKSNSNYSISNNNIDHEYVIFHVARYLASDFTFSQQILSQIKDEDEDEINDIPRIAQTKVDEWINVILQSTKSQFKFSNDYKNIKKDQLNGKKPRNIIKAT